METSFGGLHNETSVSATWSPLSESPGTADKLPIVYDRDPEAQGAEQLEVPQTVLSDVCESSETRAECVLV